MQRAGLPSQTLALPRAQSTITSRAQPCAWLQLAVQGAADIAECVLMTSPSPTIQFASAQFRWRNGWFHAQSEAALTKGHADPYPLHTEALKSVGAI